MMNSQKSASTLASTRALSVSKTRHSSAPQGTRQRPRRCKAVQRDAKELGKQQEEMGMNPLKGCKVIWCQMVCQYITFISSLCQYTLLYMDEYRNGKSMQTWFFCNLLLCAGRHALTTARKFRLRKTRPSESMKQLSAPRGRSG